MSGPVEILAYIAGVIGSVLVIGGFLRIVWRVGKRSQDLVEAAAILEPMAKAFDPEHGLSLPATIEQLLAAVVELRTATAAVAQDLRESIAERRGNARALEVAIEVLREQAIEDRRLAREDRAQLLDIIRGNMRIEAAAESAATAAEGVADRLARSQGRADEIAATEPPGSAADAASQSEPPQEP